MYQTTQ